MDLLRPRGWSLAALAAVVALMLAAYLASDYVSGLLATQAQMQQRISALEARPPATVTPSPSVPETSRPESASSKPPFPDGTPIAAASGARDSQPRSPRDPDTGGSSPPEPDPPEDSPPATPEEVCPGAALLHLCVDLALLSDEEPPNE